MDLKVSSCIRLRRLQKVCKDAGVDSLLFIPGIDGGDNNGAHQALAYLLQGTSGRDLTVSSQLQSVWEDTVFVLTPDSVKVHCQPESYDKLLPLISMWGEVQIYCATEEEVEDPDLAEAFKISSFVSMLTGLKKLGLALTPQYQGETKSYESGKAMEVETWPLVQAYGLEDVGRKGFFTMNFDITDVWDALQDQYCELDGCAVNHALTQSLPLMLTHWKEMVVSLNTRSATDRLALSERVVGESLLSYFAYGSLRTTPGIKSTALTMPPRVVFGVNTNSTGQPSSAKIGNAGPNGKPALHMVVEAADPKGPLRVARTYFLSHGVVPSTQHLKTAEERELEAEDLSDEARAALAEWSSSDTRVLMVLYTCLMDAARAAMDHLASTPGADVHSCRAAALETLQAAAASRACPLQDAEERFQFAMWACDHMNRMSAEPSAAQRQLKVVRVALPDIATAGAGLLGGLVYADTFVVHGEPGKGGEALVLTSAVPALLSWTAAGAEEHATVMVEKAIATLIGSKPPSKDEELTNVQIAMDLKDMIGHRLTDSAEEAVLCCPSRGIPFLQGQWHCFRGGVVFVSPQCAPVVVHFGQHVRAMHLHSAPGPAPHTRLTFHCNNRPVCGPLEMLAPDWSEITVSLAAMSTSAQRHFHRVVLPQWQTTARVMNISFTVADAVPIEAPPSAPPTPRGPTPVPFAGESENGHPNISPADESPAADTAKPDPTEGREEDPLVEAAQQWAEAQYAHLGEEKLFETHAADDRVRAALHATDAAEVRRTAPPAPTTLPRDAAAPAPASTPVLVLCGIPGAGHDQAVSSIVSFSSGVYAWVVAAPSLRQGMGLGGGAAAVNAALEAAVRECQQSTEGQEDGAERRIALVLQSYLDSRSLLRLLQASPAVQGGLCHLHTITVVASSQHFYEHRLKGVPGAVPSLAYGVADNVLVMGTGAMLGDVQQLVGALCPQARFCHGTRGKVHRIVDTITSPAPPSAPERLHALAVADATALPAPTTALAAVYLEVRGQLDTDLLRAELSALFDHSWRDVSGDQLPMEEPPAAPSRVYTVQGYVQRVGETVTEVEATRGRAGTELSFLKPAQGDNSMRTGALRRRCTSLPAEAVGAELLVTGTGLDTASLRALVQRCKEERRDQPLRSAESITKAEKNQIQSDHKLAPLPDGCFYNGTTYIDFEHETSHFHPLINDFVQEFIDQENATITAQNAEKNAHLQNVPEYTIVRVESL